MNTHTGMVMEVRFVDFNGTKLWSFRIDDDLTWYRTGKEKCVSEGDGVTFTEKNAQVVISTLSSDTSLLELLDRTVTAEDPGKQFYGTPTKTIDAIGVRIQYQNARRDACNIITAAIAVEISDSKGILPWATNVAKSKKLDLLRGYINELTKQFIEEENHG